jgi:hypothetical protein
MICEQEILDPVYQPHHKRELEQQCLYDDFPLPANAEKAVLSGFDHWRVQGPKLASGQSRTTQLFRHSPAEESHHTSIAAPTHACDE